jgi:hypothetical protein
VSVLTVEAVRYSAMIAYRDQRAIVRLVHKASREAGIKPSQFVRSAVAMALQMSGYDINAKDDKA